MSVSTKHILDQDDSDLDNVLDYLREVSSEKESNKLKFYAYSITGKDYLVVSATCIAGAILKLYHDYKIYDFLEEIIAHQQDSIYGVDIGDIIWAVKHGYHGLYGYKGPFVRKIDMNL